MLLQKSNTTPKYRYQVLQNVGALFSYTRYYTERYRSQIIILAAPDRRRCGVVFERQRRPVAEWSWSRVSGDRDAVPGSAASEKKPNHSRSKLGIKPQGQSTDRKRSMRGSFHRSSSGLVNSASGSVGNHRQQS